MSNQALLEHVLGRVGADAARTGTDADVIDGVQPRVVAEPPSAEALSRLLAWTSTEGLAVAVRGGGTKLAWGGLSQPIDVLLSTAGLGAVVAHRHGDLTATVEAGATVAYVNTALDTHRQWLPLDPPWPDAATIGGVVATNDSGPRRHRHGSPRDVIIGVTLARPDGEIVKAGGIVVKNVAGYDLSRLVTGAFGSLGVVLSATFKLTPVPAASRTVMIQLGSIESLEAVVQAITASALTPSAVELVWPPARILMRFESVESAVEQQAGEAGRLVAATVPSGSVTTCDGSDEAALWSAYAGRWDEPGTLLKVSTLTSQLCPTLAWLRDASQDLDIKMSAQGRAGLGVVDVRLDGPVEAQGQLVTELRSRFPSGQGSAVIRRGVPALRRSVDPWGTIGSGLPIMQAIKQQFDPVACLNRGRGPGGF